MIHERPDYVVNFVKPKNTEIKYINGHWYLYERTSVYDPKTKKMHKKSGQFLGSITENGFKAKKKSEINHKCFEDVEVVSLGASGYLWNNNSVLMKQLEKYFPDYWKELFAVAVLRLTDGPRFKRLEDSYETSCLSVLMPGLRLDRNSVTQILKSVGKRRGAITDFMKSSSDEISSYIVFDGHRIVSDSETLETAQKGYDSRRRFKEQVNLVYAFSVSGERCFPYYYKQFTGDVPDISAFSAMIEEAGIKKEGLTILADKGFGSEDNFGLIDESGLKYIIPIKRTNDDSKNNIPLSPEGYDDSFTFNGRAVLHRMVEKGGYNIHIYMDTSLFADEMGDFTSRLEKKNNTIALQKEAEKKRRLKGKSRMTDEQYSVLEAVNFKTAYREKTGFGTLALRTNNTDITGTQAYYLYKRRQAIEAFFKTYDDTLDFASSYMRDEYSEEAWLFLNHLSAIMAFRVMDEIYIRDRIKDVSLNDFISKLARIHADRIDNVWRCAKITRKRAAFADAFDLDIPALINAMNDAVKADTAT